MPVCFSRPSAVRDHGREARLQGGGRARTWVGREGLDQGRAMGFGERSEFRKHSRRAGVAGAGRGRGARTAQVSGPRGVVDDESSLRWGLEEEESIQWEALRLFEILWVGVKCPWAIQEASGRPPDTGQQGSVSLGCHLLPCPPGI